MNAPAFDLSLLANLAMFKGLTPKQLTWLGERLHYRIFPANANIIQIDQPGMAVYVLLSGTIKIHIEQTGGADVILAILGRGDTVGEMSLLDSAGRSANAVTLEETRVVWMDRDAFQEGLTAIPPLALNLVRILSARVRLANELIQALATLDVYGRVARQLLAFAERYGETLPNGEVSIPIKLTQGDISDLVGASRKRVNQVMVAFRQQNLVSANPDGRIVIHDHQGLARFCR
jgi:CRP/FNR family cyclic AMP-dependent transcriptional regulator